MKSILKAFVIVMSFGISLAQASEARAPRSICEHKAIEMAKLQYKPLNPQYCSAALASFLIAGDNEVSLPQGYLAVAAYNSRADICGQGDMYLLRILSGSQSGDCTLAPY